MRHEGVAKKFLNSKFSKIKIKKQKSVMFLYTCNDLLKKEYTLKWYSVYSRKTLNNEFIIKIPCCQMNKDTIFWKGINKLDIFQMFNQKLITNIHMNTFFLWVTSAICLEFMLYMRYENKVGEQ